MGFRVYPAERAADPGGICRRQKLYPQRPLHQPTVIKAIYDAVGRMGFETGNILEPSMGVGNFFGMLPEKMRNSHLYGVELDPISGRIAKQLYPKADITVGGFETTDRRDFFDLAIGNVPFGQYQSMTKPTTS